MHTAARAVTACPRSLCERGGDLRGTASLSDRCDTHDRAAIDRGSQAVAVGLFDLRQCAVRASGQEKLSLALGEQIGGNQCACQPRRIILAQPAADAARRLEQRALSVVEQADSSS